MELIRPKEIAEEIIDYLSPFYELSEARAISRNILEEIFDIQPNDVIVNNEIELDVKTRDRLSSILGKLAAAEPIQYILGHSWFRKRKFLVNSAVMIPRQETEEFVDLVVAENKEKNLKVLDIGVGSGCIAITLALEMDHAEVHGCDVSEDALGVAKSNAKHLRANLQCHHIDILKAFPPINDLDIIVSNPPYIRQQEQKDMESNVLEYEPGIALFVEDDDPLLFYRTIATEAKERLKVGGRLYFEINEAFGRETRDLLIQMGFLRTRIVQDLNGKDRIVVGVKRL